MDINRLRSDELTWKLKVRGSELGSTVDQKRMPLRQAIQKNMPMLNNLELDPSVELSICVSKLDELIGDIQEFNVDNRENEFKKIYSRLSHIQGRLENILVPQRLISKKDSLAFLLHSAFEALADANQIAGFVRPSSLNASRISVSGQPSVSNLINLEEQQDLNVRVQENEHRVEQENLRSRNYDQCTDLANHLNRVALNIFPVPQPHQSRHVSFPGDGYQVSNTKPLIESGPSYINNNNCPSTRLQNCNSTPFKFIRCFTESK